MTSQRFGTQLRQFLALHLRKGMTTWFNREVGLDPRNLRRWFSGKVLPTDENWANLAAALERRREQIPHLDKHLARLYKQLLLERKQVYKDIKSSSVSRVLKGALLLLGKHPNLSYLAWLNGIGRSLSLDVEIRASSAHIADKSVLVIFCRSWSADELTKTMAKVGKFYSTGRPVIWLIARDTEAEKPRFGSSDLRCEVSMDIVDDYAAVVAVWDSTRRILQKSDVIMGGNHPCMRKAVQLVHVIEPRTITTTAELEIQCLIDSLETLHHGLVVPDPSPSIDLTTSRIKVRSLQTDHKLLLEQTFPGPRTFQFAMRVRPALSRGEIFRYRYIHHCANYFPLSRVEIMERMKVGTYHLKRPYCEKSYTITNPTRRLLMRMILPKRNPKVLDAHVKATTWKSDTTDEIENQRLAMLKPVCVQSFLDQDQIELSLDNPQLFVRYRLFWTYEE